MHGVITGQDLRDIRARSGMANQQLADALGESLSTVNRWLRDGVRAEKEPKVRERLAAWLPPTEADRYTQMSDAAVLAEIVRLLGIIGQRLADRNDSVYNVRQQVDDVATDSEQSPVSPTRDMPARRIRGRGPKRT